MRLSAISALFGTIGLALAFPASGNYLERNVCIIGGGASGTYAAVRLQQMGLSVALIEQKSRLGGRPDTCNDH